MKWAVLIYVFCKLFFVVPVTVNSWCYFFVPIEFYGILIDIVFCVQYKCVCVYAYDVYLLYYVSAVCFLAFFFLILYK
jgi:hypothetical protein